MKVKSLSHVRLFTTPWTAAYLLCPWDFPGKSTGVGCHCLLRAGKITSPEKVAVRITEDTVPRIAPSHDRNRIVVALQPCPPLFNPMDCSRPASLSLTISRSLLKFMSIESVMPSNHPISAAPSPSAFYLSQHQGLSQIVGFLDKVAKVLELQLQHQFFQ